MVIVVVLGYMSRLYVGRVERVTTEYAPSGDGYTLSGAHCLHDSRIVSQISERLRRGVTCLFATLRTGGTLNRPGARPLLAGAAIPRAPDTMGVNHDAPHPASRVARHWRAEP